eukprot:SAG22_NODE_10886_length_511_cov_6.315534_1_plen_102_part_00
MSVYMSPHNIPRLQRRRDVGQRPEERVAECELCVAVLTVVDVAVAILHVDVEPGQPRGGWRREEQGQQQDPRRGRDAEHAQRALSGYLAVRLAQLAYIAMP